MIKSNKIYKKVAKVIDQYKEDVDIEYFLTSQVYSEYGDLVSQETSSYSSVPALFSKYDEMNQPQDEGIFQPGDVTVFFKGDQDGLVLGSIIIRDNGERWKIVKTSRNILNERNMAQEIGVIKDN